MSDYESFEGGRIKHLEMIQAVIARLGNDGFIVKGWAVTVAAAFYGFALTGSEWRLCLASVFVSLAFWAIDTYFLRAERLFRELYGQVRKKEEGLGPFFMAATGTYFTERLRHTESDHLLSWWRTAKRPTLLGLYATLVGAAIVLALIVGTTATSKVPPRPDRSVPDQTMRLGCDLPIPPWPGC